MRSWIIWPPEKLIEVLPPGYFLGSSKESYHALEQAKCPHCDFAISWISTSDATPQEQEQMRLKLLKILETQHKVDLCPKHPKPPFDVFMSL